MNLFVTFVDLNVETPVESHLFYRRIENVADLRVSRSEVTLVNFRKLPEAFADAAAAYPRFAAAETCNVCFELMRHGEKARLRDVKRRTDRHLEPSRLQH